MVTGTIIMVSQDVILTLSVVLWDVVVDVTKDMEYRVYVLEDFNVDPIKNATTEIV
jgi:hypothetical protein